jgi:hypothetical protein
MASTTLPNGIIIPEKFSRDWYADLYHNWQELDNLLGGGTPKDGTLTIQKNGDTVGTFSANQATDETINITVPDVNNGTLTIQKNGDTVGTFSANQATDETINIEVPDVNNGTLTIQQNGTTVDSFSANSSSDKTVNIQCVDLENNQTVAGNKEFTGTTTAHDLVPSATDTYNFGSSTAQWNNAYIKSLTINGTQFLPSDYMTLNTIQTVTSAKYYTNYQYINSYRLRIKNSAQEKGVIPEFNLWNGFAFCDKNNENMFSIEQGMMTNGVIQLNFAGRANDNDTTYTTFLRYINNSDLTTNVVNIIDLMPFENGTRKLGDTNAKWKSFNGINPGALSLPSTSSGINLDLTGFKLDGSDNKFRLTNFSNYPYDNGWLFIRLNGCTSYYLDHWYKVVSNEYANPSTAIFFMPINDIDHDILLRCVCTSINYIRVFPCQGNV